MPSGAGQQAGLLAAACLLLDGAVAAAEAEGTCPAGVLCQSTSGEPQYYWPSCRGVMEPGRYSVSPYRPPSNWTKKLKWSFHGVGGKWSTIFNGGVVIDHQKNVYTSSHHGVYKLNEWGSLIWVYPARTSTVPVIANGTLYSTSMDGTFVAVDMETGKEVWKTKVTPSIGGDISGVGVKDGIMVCSSFGHPQEGAGDARVTAVNASTGNVLWEFNAHSQLWNFMPIFTGKGSFVFQDQIGGVYHLSLNSGELLWKAGYKGDWTDTWTDGVTMIGPNDVVYAVHANCAVQYSKSYPQCTPTTAGDITAYRLSNGEMLWRQPTPYSPNSQPMVARLGRGSGLSVVLPVAQPAGLPPSSALWFGGWPNTPDRIKDWIFTLSLFLGEKQTWLWGNTPNPAAVTAYDGETGKVRWRWQAPTLTKGFSAGDEEGLRTRYAKQSPSPICIPNLWASPTIDPDGNIYVGHANGYIYSIKDANEDGVISESEVINFDTEVAFGHPGAGFAPGMMVIANCDAVLSFQD